ncbi:MULTISPECIES: PLP-dependent aspartate aminotransferase family protein [unclassified Pseudomonas]|uniref:trans-sulfuration enzyme family protein n=1 Tax=unclassified Pseudomonas TaxID=196821 RepID=UPI000D3718ED|nr:MULTISPECIES: PLP-dependent aspartate aminotransferase family protein [unclassified Pseudomonas]RAU43832.1 PLP-dependent transferase [Pseudomonas sp. RIT 409]RAU56274.1 PLP-dependent transferase [Pseudomonas sp. RIT 412]
MNDQNLPITDDDRSLLLIQADHFVDDRTGALVPPIHTSTVFARDENYELIGNIRYGRYGNPTTILAEELLAKLEGGREARLFGSGLAATTAILETVKTGQHILAPQVMYHGAQKWMRRIAERRGIELSFFDQSKPGAMRKAIRPNTGLLWIEAAVNPTWDIIDIKEAADAVHAVGGILCVDGSVSPPVTSHPLELGADIVFHSCSKYLNGHSDVLAGVLVTNTLDARWDEVNVIRNLSGAVLGAFESWLLIRGMRTLSVRFERASDNALALAKHFLKHPKVQGVLYPGLESHPGHEVAKRQMTNGFGGMMSILFDGSPEDVQRVACALKVFIIGASLGGVESLVEHRASVEGPDSVVPKNLLRFSVGIEPIQALIGDLEQALDVLNK